MLRLIAVLHIIFFLSVGQSEGYYALTVSKLQKACDHFTICSVIFEDALEKCFTSSDEENEVDYGSANEEDTDSEDDYISTITLGIATNEDGDKQYAVLDEQMITDPPKTDIDGKEETITEAMNYSFTTELPLEGVEYETEVPAEHMRRKHNLFTFPPTDPPSTTTKSPHTTYSPVLKYQSRDAEDSDDIKIVADDRSDEEGVFHFDGTDFLPPRERPLNRKNARFPIRNSAALQALLAQHLRKKKAEDPYATTEGSEQDMFTFSPEDFAGTTEHYETM